MSIVIWVVSLGVLSFVLALRSMKHDLSNPMPEPKKHMTHHHTTKDTVDEKKRGSIHGTIVQL